ncbi:MULTISPECIES: response regulator transcription factor [unclassified Neptuniibacter]|jgi:two-component system nitrate/nitrite response regulator NarL|uniref:response regulator n=1 Tax=unclassified Neptuniibacter TaxID=2630693 RepID=UPI0026E30819|nr:MULTISPECIES: response regulator transcription factor [unclassified Neptuniibacter]MDO6512600.1 response regulator transcription factor [Neptuniibacter sp. 2_MG-2023]MDO6593565.1 response regulator transcription factor [Neptuniibacter sp. 1_MG-2023]
MPSDNKIRVLLVDDHPLVLDGISARLEGEPSLEIIGMANDGKQALALASTLHPDVVLMDISMPVMNGFEASERFHAEQPDVKVLILSMHDDREYIVKLIKCGAAGYVLKDVSSNELISAIETVYGGGTYFSSGASQSLFSQFDQEGGHANTQQEELTGREKDVLKLVAEGNSNKEIARELDISVRTVETHRQNIKQKLDIHTAAGLTRYAIEHKLVD